MNLPSVRITVPVILAAALACSQSASRGEPKVERLTLGDTTIIRTTGDGTWGPIRDAVEEKRVGNSGSVAFGQIGSAIALPNGGALVFDTKALNGPALELFDSNGTFVGPVGRAGGGPGEYATGGAVTLAAGSSGILLVLDARNNRVDRFSASGRPLSSIPIVAVTGNGPPEFLRGGADGSVYVWSYVNRERGLSPREMTGYIHYDSTGRVIDTIPAQRTWFAVDSRLATDPHDQWSALNDGRVLVARTDLFGFLIKPPTGTNGMIEAVVTGEAARIEPAERQEIQAMVNAWPQDVTDDGKAIPRIVVPDHKPAIRAVMIDGDGRIWLQRNVASIKVPPHAAPGAPKLQQTYDQPTVWAAFKPDGTYLGDVRFPPAVRVFGFTHDAAWAAILDNGAQVLVRYRIPGISGK